MNWFMFLPKIMLDKHKEMWEAREKEELEVRKPAYEKRMIDFHTQQRKLALNYYKQLWNQ